MRPHGIIPAESLRIPGSTVLRFEGEHHGAMASFFLVTSDPGRGPRLHRHPYDETFHVLEGEASIVIGDRELVARDGDTAVVPPNTWHRFTNPGPGMLRIVCLHASPVMIQEFAEDL